VVEMVMSELLWVENGPGARLRKSPPVADEITMTSG
jgi:hypothetical protein